MRKNNKINRTNPRLGNFGQNVEKNQQLIKLIALPVHYTLIQLIQISFLKRLTLLDSSSTHQLDFSILKWESPNKPSKQRKITLPKGLKNKHILGHDDNETKNYS